jgi:hypothetical protein
MITVLVFEFKNSILFLEMILLIGVTFACYFTSDFLIWLIATELQMRDVVS